MFEFTRGRRGTKYFAAVVLVGIAFFFCLLCFSLSNSAAEQSNDSAVPAGLTVVDEDRWNEVVSCGTATAMDRSAILFDGARIAYNAADVTFYIPQDMESDLWSGTFTSSGLGNLLVRNDAYLYDKSGAIADGHSFACLYQSGSEYSLFYLVFTGLPTVSIDYNPDEAIVEKEDHEGRIYVQETDGVYQVSECVFHVRGQVASALDKKSWKISLTTASGDKNHLSFCGMRDDDDWILNAMALDPTRIREPLAYWVWDTMQSMTGYPSSSPDMQFAELFLNDEYCGLYLLMEPLDGKTLDLTDEDFLYQAYSYELPDDLILTEYNGISRTDYGEIRWPKSGNESSALTWDLLQYIYDYGYRSITWDELLSGGDVLDIMNMAIYDVFTVLTYAYDNVYHNMMFACTLQEDGTYSVEQIPWDLNYVFGCTWSGNYDGGTAFAETFEPSYADHNFLWDAFISEFPEEAQECTRIVWQTLRDAGLDADLVCSKGESLWHEISDSGAFAREKECWEWVEDLNIDEEDVLLVFEWIRNRFDTLDSFYGYDQN